MVPLQPGQPPTVGAETWIGIKVGAGGEDHTAALVACGVERDDGIDRFPIAGVVLAHGDESRAVRIEDHIGVAQCARWRDRPGRVVAVYSVEPGVGKVREDEHAVSHRVRTAAVLVDAGAGVESGWDGISDRPVRGATHDDRASGFRRAVLDPVDIVTVDTGAYDADALPRNEVSGDWRAPGAVGSGFGGLSHEMFLRVSGWQGVRVSG